MHVCLFDLVKSVTRIAIKLFYWASKSEPHKLEMSLFVHIH